MALCDLMTFFFLSFPWISQSSSIKSVELTTSNTNENGADISVSYNDGSAWIENNRFIMDIKTQQGFSWLIDLDNTWGFHPHKSSTILFTMYSSDSYNSADDLDLYITYVTNNNKYISYSLNMDSGGWSNEIYPVCDTDASPTLSIPTGDSVSCVEQTTCNSVTSREDKMWWDTSTDCYIYPKNEPNEHPNTWPITVSLTNDPINNQAFTTISCSSWGSWTQGCGYGDTFNTNAGLQIYISADDNGEHCEFTKFRIEYLHETDNPTSLPTKAPTTDTPTAQPSQSPITSVPTELPSLYPIAPSSTSTKISVVPSVGNNNDGKVAEPAIYTSQNEVSDEVSIQTDQFKQMYAVMITTSVICVLCGAGFLLWRCIVARKAQVELEKNTEIVKVPGRDRVHSDDMDSGEGKGEMDQNNEPEGEVDMVNAPMPPQPEIRLQGTRRATYSDSDEEIYQPYDKTETGGPQTDGQARLDEDSQQHATNMSPDDVPPPPPVVTNMCVDKVAPAPDKSISPLYCVTSGMDARME